jgi:hypothetical protein
MKKAYIGSDVIFNYLLTIKNIDITKHEERIDFAYKCKYTKHVKKVLQDERIYSTDYLNPKLLKLITLIHD